MELPASKRLSPEGSGLADLMHRLPTVPSRNIYAPVAAAIDAQPDPRALTELDIWIEWLVKKS